VPSNRRNLGMVFQSYAVWPHMTVFENVAYPLAPRGLAKAVVRDRVARVLDLVGLGGMEARPGTLLSGGQMQRLALCRALVYEPDLLLRRIILRLMAPTLLAVGMITFVGAARNIGNFALLTTSANRPLSILQLDYVAQRKFEEAVVVACIIMLVSLAGALLARLIGLRSGGLG